MKKKLMSNMSLKLISVVFAIVLWLVVVNVDDPVTTRKFSNIPVSILNENLISDAGEIYEVLDKSNQVTVTVKAKRSIVESLSVDDFKATADFAERISENSIPIKVEALKRAKDIVDILLHNNTVKIAVEEKKHKEVPVELQINGKTAEGFTVGASSIYPEMIPIAGPARVITKVTKVVVPVNVNGASEDITLTENGQFYGESGEPIIDKRIEGDISRIQVNVHLLHTKSIDLNLTTEGEPAGDYRCQDIQYAPTTITIAGELVDLERINTLDIPSSELNIEGARENIVKDIDVTRFLPENIIICNEEEKTIRVTLVISALDGKEFKIPMSAVDVLNTPAGTDTVLDDSKTVSVIVKGSTEDLNNLTQDQIKVSIDIKGKAVGTYNLQADVSVPNGYVVMNRPMVSVLVKPSGGESYENPATVIPMQPTDVVPETHQPQHTPEIHVTPTPAPQPVPSVAVPTPTPVAQPTEEPGEENE